MSNAATIAATLRAPIAAVRASEIEHLSAGIAATLRAPVVAAMVGEIAHISAGIGAVLQAPRVLAMAGEVEHLSAGIAATLRAPSASAAADMIGHGEVGLGIRVPAPVAHVGATMTNPVWGIAPKTLTASPRLYPRHRRYRSPSYIRHGGQGQAFIWKLSQRVNQSCHDLFYELMEK